MDTVESWGVMDLHRVQARYKYSTSFIAKETDYKHRPDEPYWLCCFFYCFQNNYNKYSNN